MADAPVAEPETHKRFEVGRLDPGAVIAWLIPATLIIYLALKNGGYDPIPRGDAGVLAWWIVLVGLAVGALPAIRLRSIPGTLIVLLVAFAAWTALSLVWSQSDERTMTELARVATYVGFLVLAVALQQRGYGRALLYGATAGIAVIIVLAALSRMEPPWFPTQTTARFITGIDIERRLSYPRDYSTGLAAMTAMGIPLFLQQMTSAARSLDGASAP